jgi:hypothetical protein
MKVCFHWCIYKVILSLYFDKLTTYHLYILVYLPNLAYKPISPRLPTYLFKDMGSKGLLEIKTLVQTGEIMCILPLTKCNTF